MTVGKGKLNSASRATPGYREHCSLSEVYKQTSRIAEATRAYTDCQSRAPNETANP
jgi:hypothetical protein